MAVLMHHTLDACADKYELQQLQRSVVDTLSSASRGSRSSSCSGDSSTTISQNLSSAHAPHSCTVVLAVVVVRGSQTQQLHVPLAVAVVAAAHMMQQAYTSAAVRDS
jgi:hypothetical protein